ncbi:prp4, putative [Ricinus communis]|uniref:non-specific serine/threonine protein kinase n=1 Tax=Ricinus communis TaxID=3988 RepID=B9ST07_RICCO|nr:prp4, putative [Ricinus communis]
MASESDVTHRKHRRSPSDEADKSSKRHKHRHHRHHRSHRSKKHGDDETNHGNEEAFLPVPVVANSNRGGDDDVEEGEILEEEEGSGDVNVKAFTSQNLEVHADNVDSGLTNYNGKVSFPKDSRTDSLEEIVSGDDQISHANGDLGHEKHPREAKKQHGESRSSSRRSHKRKSYGGDETPDGDETKLSNLGISSSSDSAADRLKTVTAYASHGRYHDEVVGRSGSLSREFARERSRSRSIVEEDVLLKRRQHNEKAENDSADERMPGHDEDLWRSSRDVERECSTNYIRSQGGEERHGSWNTQGREREMNWEQRREQGRERSRERDQRRDKDRERSRERDQRRDKDRERSRDRDLRREKGREGSRDSSVDRYRRREKEQERSRDREVDRDLKRQKQQERSWDREVDRDQRKERQWERSLDREMINDRRREREQGRSREEELDKKRQKEKDRSKDKSMSRANERDRDWERVKETDRGSYAERERARDRDWVTDRERRSDRSREKARETNGDSAKFYNFNSNSLEGDRDKLERDEDAQDDFEERIALKLAEQEEDLDRVKEESRKLRQAILEKFRNQQKQQQNETQSDNVEKETINVKVEPSASLPASNVASETIHVKMENDDFITEPAFSVGKSPLQNGIQDSERTSGVAGLGEGTPKSEGSDEKYCDDIFGETPARIRKPSKGDGLPITRTSLYDNWDDADGYYGYRFGETLDGRYEIVAAQGKGVFSTVVRAKDLKAGVGEPEEVAIKIIRNKELMHKAGQNEVQIFDKLAAADPENKRHCVRFLSSFKYRNHLCLVFESLHMNLREVLKKFGRNIGLKLTAVKAYAKQLFIALKHLKNCEVLHCDIKPDNMLVNEAKNVLKLCDFGNAMFAGKNEITPYLVSRFYRAPEIILGLPYDHPVDMWSVGCCLYELYAGKVLFPGATNNDMLRLHMELKGPFPKKMLKKGAFVDQHFDQDLNFNSMEEDPVTKKIIKRMLLNIKPKDIGSIIMSSPGEDPKMLANFKDLLDKIFMLDPEKRLTVNQALGHPFITGK